jgi:glycosyltransferase involved in cell wall biosynthesis
VPDRLVITTPWWPSENNPFAGAFVAAQAQAVAPLFDRVDVVHTEDWATPADGLSSRFVQKAYEKLVGGPRPRVPVAQASRHEHAGATVWQLPTPVQPGRDYAAWARTHEWVVRTALRGRIVDAPVVHGHTGIYGGWVATSCGRADSRIVVTEHATFLPRVLKQPAAREMYRQVLERADAFFVVGSILKNWLRNVYPDLADRVRICPNVVPTDQIPMRPEPVTDLRRWIYLGKFAPHKRVDVLLEAFAVVAVERGDLELTLVGTGPLEDQLRARAAALGLADRVAFVPSVPNHEVPALLHRHDLLVHPSSIETFGMTTVEAVASGLPVLVTASGGPDETLAGIEQEAGEIVPVADGLVEILAGYRRLAARLDELDPVRARAAIESRYGPAAVAEILLAAYTGREPGSSVVAGGTAPAPVLQETRS